jgi:ComF family protein
LRKLIHLFKYAGMRPLARPLADFLSLALPRDERFDVIVAVPLHWRKQWRRKFNQSELLARAISRRTAIPVCKALKRVRPTSAQAGLSNAARRRNVAAAFQCRLPAAVRGKRILLIDDVMTTGATAAACALALKRAGAVRVALLTVARVDRRLHSFDAAPDQVLVGGLS